MSRKVVLIVVAALLAFAPLVGGLTAVAVMGPGKALLWADRQVKLMSVRGGPEVVLEVDRDAVRSRSYDLLRRSVVLHLRDAKLTFNTRLTDAGVDVSAQEADRETVMGVLRRKLASRIEIRLADDGVVRVHIPEAMLAESTAEAAEESQLRLSSRFSSLGIKAVATVQLQPAAARLLIQMARTEDPQRLIAFATKPGRLAFRMIDVSVAPEKAMTSTLPPGTEILYGRAEDGKPPFLVEKRIVMSGADLDDAQPGFDQRTDEPIVIFRFGTAGARKFAQATNENVGRPFAIVVDGEVLSAPVIREPITGGSGQISGNFTVQSASDLAAILRHGELPARLKVVEERTAKVR